MKSFSRLALILICSFSWALGPASAQSGAETAGPAERPLIAYPKSGPSARSSGAAAELLTAARRDGRIRVLVGLRLRMVQEDGLSRFARAAQARELRRMQDAVIARVLGAPRSAQAGAAVNRFWAIPFIAVDVTPAELARLLDDPDVASVEKNGSAPPLLAQSIPLIHADEVWNLGIVGDGATVAILDTGVARSHPMITGGRIVAEACFSTRSGSFIRSVCPPGVRNPGPGAAVNCPVNVVGCDHGTHVASIAAGRPAALTGVARGARIIAVQVFSRYNPGAMCDGAPCCKKFPCARYLDEDLLDGLQFVYGQRKRFKVAAVNMSLGGGLFSGPCDSAFAALSSAIGLLRSANIAAVVASGNSKSDGAIASPACISSAVAVGNAKDDVEDLEHLYFTSNHSPLVKLLAPGTQIQAAVPPGAPCGSGYCYKTGTSMAAPHVAGAFALLQQAKPSANVDERLRALVCTGKIVEDRERRDGGLAPLGTVAPRIDLIGAYSILVKPPRTDRSWSFDEHEEALDWTPFRGRWSAGGGRYRQHPIRNGGFAGRMIASSVDNCDTSLEIVATMRRVDPTLSVFDPHWHSGFVYKSKLDYHARTISGYYVSYDHRYRETAPPHQTGGAKLFRVDRLNADTGIPASYRLLCEKWPVRVVVNGSNTLRVVSRGSSHSLYLNGKFMCSGIDPTYTSGPVLLYAGLPTDASGHAFAVEKVSIKSLGGSQPAEPFVVDPGALAPPPEGMAAGFMASQVLPRVEASAE